MQADESEYPPLTEPAKGAIRGYLFKLIVPSALVLSLGSAALGFIINEWARGQAYVKAYGDAITTILVSAASAGAAKGQAEAAAKQISEAQQDVSIMRESVQKSKVDAENLLKGRLDDIAKELLKDPRLQSSLANVSNDEIKRLSDLVSRPIKLQCKSMSADSGPMRSPTVQATVPAEEIKDGYSLTAGGCELSGGEPGQAAGRAHNGPITMSKPNTESNSWHCRAMDPPNIALVYSVRAWVVYCRAGIS